MRCPYKGQSFLFKGQSCQGHIETDTQYSQCESQTHTLDGKLDNHLATDDLHKVYYVYHYSPLVSVTLEKKVMECFLK